ncbi:uncharacterized protein [Apostichopus japonicus]|uniref:uncharacterized protein isoform X2 n=1 Tax=Stichopus japonicus TaxID=307972 RepID=UPI003AB417D1
MADVSVKTNDLEASKSPNENDQPTDNTANQTRRFLEVDYRNTKHSAICSIIVFLALILILGAVMFVLIFLLDGQEAGPDRELQTELKGTFILSVTITIVNLDYQSSLSDPTSKDYIDLENRFSKKIASVLSQTDLMDKYRGVEITNVRSGSVILDFLLLFCEPLMTQDDVIQTVQEALTSSGSPNTVVGDELIISQNNLVIEAAPQQTSLQNISCSDPRPTSTPVMTSSPSTVMSSSTSQPLSPTPTSSPTSTPAVSSSISTLTPASSSVTSSQTTSMTPSVEMTMMTSSIITSQAAVPTTTSTAPSLSSTMAAKTTTMTSTSMSSSAQPTTTQMQTAPPTRSTTAALQPSTTISSKRTGSITALMPSMPPSIFTSSNSLKISPTAAALSSITDDVSMTSSMHVTLLSSLPQGSNSSQTYRTGRVSTNIIFDSSMPPVSSRPSTSLPNVSQPPLLSTPPVPSGTSIRSTFLSSIPPSISISSGLKSSTIDSLLLISDNFGMTSPMHVSSNRPQLTRTSHMPSAFPSASIPIQTNTVAFSHMPPLPSKSSTSLQTMSPSSSFITASSPSTIQQVTSSVSTTLSLDQNTVSPSSPYSATTSMTSGKPNVFPSRSSTIMKSLTLQPTPGFISSSQAVETSSSHLTTSLKQATVMLTTSPTLIVSQTKNTASSNVAPLSSTSTSPMLVSSLLTSSQFTTSLPTSHLVSPTSPLPIMGSSRIASTTLLLTSSTSLPLVQSSSLYVTPATSFHAYSTPFAPSVSTFQTSRTVLMSSTVTPEQTTQMMTTSIGGMETSPSVTQPTVTTTTESLPGCDISQGQILSAGDVKVITSPGYPRGYLNNLNCHWSITGIASENMVILLEFVFFDVGDDYLEVDIPTEGQINQRFSGSSTPPSIRSQDRNIQLRFVSDGAVTSIGFEVRLRLVSVLETTPPAITTEDMGVLETSPSVTQPTVIATTESLPNCDISQGQILSAGDVKVISSPGYPRGYLNNLNCQWSVTGIASENMVILLEFVFFDVGDDYLEVNIPTEGQINQRFSGSSTPPSIRSQDRNIQLRFVSDGAVTSIGFEVRLRLVSVLETTPPAITTEALGGMDTSPSVTKPTVIATTGSLPGCDISQGQILSAGDVKIISSPGYPRGYLNNLNCEWSVTGIASENMVILLEFVFFDVGDDYLEVNIPTEGQINQRFSGSSTPPSIRSQDQNIQLRFVSDGAITSIGFQVTVRLVSVLETTPPTLTTEAMACSDDLSFVTQEQNQTLTSPGYPNAYSSNMNCQWMLQSTIPNSQIILTFLTFDIGDDLLRIEHNGRTVELTGADLPMPIITDSANVNLVFTSNNVNNQNPGFEILAHIYIPPVSTQAQLTEITTTAPPQIPIAPPDNSCIPGSILISVESGPKTFSSPGYPDYNYASNTECSWNFILIGSSIENKALQLRFVNFDVGDDSVVVEGSSPAIRRFQGSALPPLIISSGNKFVIKLTTDSQDNHPGFNATVSVVDK